MSKAILISINPKWVAKILNGEKTIEIRKTMPKCDLPVDVYIYCTSHKNYTQSLYKVCEEDGGGYDVDYYNPCVSKSQEKDFLLNSQVVAKFTLRKVEEIKTCESHSPELLNQSCLDVNEFYDYLTKGKNFIGQVLGYVWHIDNLEIFDKPKYLCDFWNTKKGVFCCPLTKAPQSFMYVEV